MSKKERKNKKWIRESIDLFGKIANIAISLVLKNNNTRIVIINIKKKGVNLIILE